MEGTGHEARARFLGCPPPSAGAALSWTADTALWSVEESAAFRSAPREAPARPASPAAQPPPQPSPQLLTRPVAGGAPPWVDAARDSRAGPPVKEEGRPTGRGMPTTSTAPFPAHSSAASAGLARYESQEESGCPLAGGAAAAAAAAAAAMAAE